MKPNPAVGDRFGLLTVIDEAFFRMIQYPSQTKAYRVWFTLCRCECGASKEVSVYNLRSGVTTSCGCRKRTAAAERTRTHGKSQTKLYAVWKQMNQRCGNPDNVSYKRYGGRGIRVESPWDTDFEAFERWAIAAGWEDGLKIDRADNGGNYSQMNCRIVTNAVNCRNKENNHTVEAFGETKCVLEWSEDSRCKVKRQTLLKRLRLGWDSEKAITEEARRMKSQSAAP